MFKQIELLLTFVDRNPILVYLTFKVNKMLQITTESMTTRKSIYYLEEGL